MPRGCTAIVLAAGHSRRMGRAKSLLRLDGESLLMRVTRLALAQACEHAVVVVGDENDTGTLLGRDTAQCMLADFAGRVTVTLGLPNGTPLDSLRAGLRAVPPSHHVLFWPVDFPFATPALLRQLATALADDSARIALPRYRGRGGHPVLFGAAVVAELRHAVLPHGARDVVHHSPERVVAIEVDDERVVQDVDTPEDAARLGVV